MNPVLMFKENKSTGRVHFLPGLVLAFAMLVFAGFPGYAIAQPPIGPGSPTGQGKQDIFQLISRLKSTINESSPGSRDDGTITPSPETSFGTLSNNSDLSGSEDGKMDSIQQKLEMLRKLMDEQKSGQPASDAIANSNPANPAPINNPLNPDLPGAAPFPMPENLEPTTGNDSSQNNDSAEGNMDSAGSLPEFKTIVATPVDSLELAGSLFAIGNYPMALKTWQQVSDRIADPHERQWLDYFLASSQRITGKREEAELAYRELVSRKQKGYPVTAAEEWLTWMEKRKQSQSAMDEVFSALDTIQKELEKNGK